jgi:hypothetical protein
MGSPGLPCSTILQHFAACVTDVMRARSQERNPAYVRGVPPRGTVTNVTDGQLILVQDEETAAGIEHRRTHMSTGG